MLWGDSMVIIIRDSPAFGIWTIVGLWFVFFGNLHVLIDAKKSAPPNSSTLDFSYLHRVKSSILGEAIRQNILQIVNENKENQEEDAFVEVDLDISSSMIDKNLQDLISSIEESLPKPVSLKLIARANQWNINDATSLLQSIVEASTPPSCRPVEEFKAESKTESISKEDATTAKEVDDTKVVIVDDEKTLKSSEGTNETVIVEEEDEEKKDEDNDDVDIESNLTVVVDTTNDENTTSIDNNETTVDTENIGKEAIEDEDVNEEETAPKFNISISSLDLGWNNLAQLQSQQPQSQEGDGSSSSSSRRRRSSSRQQQKSNKLFLKSLTNLIANKVACPQTLKFPVCGLGPGACRAIGKVSISSLA